MGMVEVKIDSIRVSLMSQHRIVLLKDLHSERYLPIWIGQSEADAITIELKHVGEIDRPLTHDLLKSVITEMGGTVKYVLVNDMRSDIFYANIIVHTIDETLHLDSRPSDAIALAVRAKVPVYVDEKVMDMAVTPDEEVRLDDDSPAPAKVDEEKLSLFKDFVDSLDLDDLEDS